MTVQLMLHTCPWRALRFLLHITNTAIPTIARNTAAPIAIPTAAPTPSPSFLICVCSEDVVAVLPVVVVETSDARYNICNMGTTAENVEITVGEDDESVAV